MRPGYQRLVFRLQCWILRENGQDLVEYALVLGVVAGVITASNHAVANTISTVFSNLATQFSATV
jgi:Flp pilus assembly pilin Flp